MREKRQSHDWFAVFVIIALLPIPLYYLVPGMPLFKPSGVGNASVYGFVVYFTLILDFLRWMAKESRNKHFPKNVLTILGFRWGKQHVVAGFAIGCLAGVLMWHIKSGFSSIVPPFDLVADMLLGAPLVEEVLFRGFLINRILRSDRTFQKKILAIVASILIFSWMHASYPEQKVVGGIIFTAVYLWGWKNNMTAAIAAHLGSNATILFFGYSSLGITVMIKTTCIIVAMVSLVFLILWFVYPITSVLVRIFAKFLQKIPRRKIS